MPVLPPASKTAIAIGVLLSGICWYFTFSLSGDFWYLLWIAPIPILYFSLLLKTRWAFTIAFVSYLIGRLSWLPYLLSVLPLPLAIMFTLVMPLVFALIVIATRKMVLKWQHWSAVFAFPVLFTSFEYISFLFSQDGTAGSIAYTQCNFLPVMQIASITGITGITFLTTLFPSAVALIVFNIKMNRANRAISWIAFSILGVALLSGGLRLIQNTPSQQTPLTIGMATIDEDAHHGSYSSDHEKQFHLVDLYLAQVSALAKQGAQIITMPEKMFRLTTADTATVFQQFKDTALKYHVTIILSFDQQKTDYYENRAWVISDKGQLLADYQKVHLFEGEVLDTVRPGKSIGLFTRENAQEGVAICKDLDFQQYIGGYGKAGAGLLYVPAWDFVIDGWLHSRMAICRGIEGGYNMIRNARQGRLTISDHCGKVLFEGNSESGEVTQLVGKVTTKHYDTVYSRFGDWFGVWIVVVAGVWLVVMSMKRNRSTTEDIPE